MAKKTQSAQAQTLVVEEEIDLFELWQTLWAKKEIILLFSFIPLILVGLYYGLRGVPYQYEFYIYPSNVKVLEGLPLPKRNFYLEELKKIAKSEGVPNFKITNERSNEEFIAVQIEDTKAQTLKEKAEKVINSLQKSENFLRTQRVAKELLEKELFNLQKDRDFIKEIKKRNNLVLGFDILERDYQLRQREILLKEALKNPNLFYVEYPEVPKRANIRKALLVSVAFFITGFFFGIFYVLVQKAIENRQKAYG